MTERPVALVELLGRARGLIPGEACMICKTAVSLLLSTQTKEDPETKDGVTSKEEVAAGGSSGESNEGVTGKEQDSAVNQASFPLDVDQKVVRLGLPRKALLPIYVVRYCRLKR